jgi:hypothetical protein
MFVARSHRVAVDALGMDLLASATLQRLVYAQYEWFLRHEDLH